MEPTLLEKLSEELEEFSITGNDDILVKMQELCYQYGRSAEDLVQSWVAFSATKQYSNEPTLELLCQLEREELAKKSNKPAKGFRQSQPSNTLSAPIYNAATIDLIDANCCTQLIEGYGSPDQMTSEDKKKNLLSSQLRSPAVPFSPASFSPAQVIPSAKYGSRNASGEIVCSHGKTEDLTWRSNDNFSCTIAPYNKASSLQERYHYMFQKLRDQGAVLNDMIEDRATEFQNKYEIKEWAPVQLPAVEEVPVVGRICSDGSGKMNTVSLLFEGSQETSSGHVVPLDVSLLQKFSFFPGQIIAGQGINNQGKKLYLKQLYEHIFPPFPPESPDFGMKTDSLNFLLASGPYTTSDSLSYEPLTDLLKYLRNNNPHVCILCGPFVDIKHEQIEKGNLLETYNDMFQRLISTILQALEGTNTKVVLLPSLRDAHHDCIYPTPPYQVKAQFKNLYLASDPCLLNINGIVFGVTSTDILFHLGKEEINFPPQSSDRLGRLCCHLLTQKNFYPLYPSSEDVNIDYIHFETYALLPVTPHFLILPSDLRSFIKDVNGCCCINPERLTKRFVGGTFARIKVESFDKNKYTGSVIDYTQVEIVKI